MEERLNTFEDIQDVHSGLLSETVKPHTINVPTEVTQYIASTVPVASTAPSVANTVATTITSETQLKTLMDGLAKLITTAKDTNSKQQPRRTKGGRKDNKLMKTWRQYTYWCYTCGVNLTHNTTGGCIRVPKRQ